MPYVSGMAHVGGPLSRASLNFFMRGKMGLRSPGFFANYRQAIYDANLQ